MLRFSILSCMPNRFLFCLSLSLILGAHAFPALSEQGLKVGSTGLATPAIDFDTFQTGGEQGEHLISPDSEDFPENPEGRATNLKMASASRASLEEVQIIGRSTRNGEDKLYIEKLMTDAYINVLSNKEISNNGDSNVAQALIRLPSVSLVNEEFVYIRGLGERYASSYLNKASVPSPDLTRDVLPLNIFPTSVLSSLVVQKAYTVDRPASFGGGAIDVRTLKAPKEFQVKIDLDLGANLDSSEGYKGHPSYTTEFGSRNASQRELPTTVMEVLATTNGQLSPHSIARISNSPIEQARELNRELASSFNRDFDIASLSPDPDYSIGISGGDYYSLHGQQGESGIGFLAQISLEQKQTHHNSNHRAVSNSESNFSNTDESEKEINLTTYISINSDIDYANQLSLNYLFLRNTVDTTYIEDIYHATFSENQIQRDFWLRYEQRDLQLWQVSGEHGSPGNFQIDWNVSRGSVDNIIPSELNLTSRVNFDPQTGAQTSNFISNKLANTELAYTDLSDILISYAVNMRLPLDADNQYTLEFGFDGTNQFRNLDSHEFLLGSNENQIQINDNRLLANLFTEEDNAVLVDYRDQASESFSASTHHLGFYLLGIFPLVDHWRLNAGLRWERYRQRNQLRDPITLNGVGNVSVLEEVTIHPALNFVYSVEKNNWSDTYQLRLAYSVTVVRPDLREISSATYVDPVTKARVTGNINVTPSIVENYDVSSTWQFDSKEFFGLVFFYKGIANPIETFDAPTSDNDTSSRQSQQIANAKSAYLYGMEIQGRVNLHHESLFFQSNLTLMQSELTASVDSFSPTNLRRKLTNASDYTVNLILGYESENDEHNVRLSYNLFGERLHYAGRNGTPDALEQPINWLNFNYLYHIDNNFDLNFRLTNILDENVVIQRLGQDVFRSNIGREFSLGFSWRY